MISEKSGYWDNARLFPNVTTVKSKMSLLTRIKIRWNRMMFYITKNEKYNLGLIALTLSCLPGSFFDGENE